MDYLHPGHVRKISASEIAELWEQFQELPAETIKKVALPGDHISTFTRWFQQRASLYGKADQACRNYSRYGYALAIQYVSYFLGRFPDACSPQEADVIVQAILDGGSYVVEDPNEDDTLQYCHRDFVDTTPPPL